jgi:tetratricopeptide (TPR) repeat protein
MGWQWQRAEDRRREAEAHAEATARERDKTEWHFRVTHQAVIALSGAHLHRWGSDKPINRLADKDDQDHARTALPYYRFLVEQRPDDEEVLMQAAYVEQLVGYAHREAGEYDEAVACYQASLRVFARLRQITPDGRRYVWGEAGSFYELALAHEMAGRPADALDPATRACSIYVEVINSRPDLLDGFRGILNSCRRIRKLLESLHGPGGAIRRLKTEGWLDPPSGPTGAGDRARMAVFVEFSFGLAKRCQRAGDWEGERIGYDSACGLSAALGSGDPVTPGTSPDQP